MSARTKEEREHLLALAASVRDSLLETVDRMEELGYALREEKPALLRAASNLHTKIDGVLLEELERAQRLVALVRQFAERGS